MTRFIRWPPACDKASPFLSVLWINVFHLSCWKKGDPVSKKKSKYADLAASGPEGLKQELSLPELSSFGITSSAPLTVVAGALVAMHALGVPGVPVAFIAVTLGAALWAVGYIALSRSVHSAGAQAVC